MVARLEMSQAGMVSTIVVLVLVACGNDPEPTRSPANPSIPNVHHDAAVATKADTKSTEMRCTLRVSATGLYVDGEPTSQRDAIAICKQRAGAMVVVEDDVSREVWKNLEAAFRDEKITVLLRGPLGHAECTNNPLAKGCQ
jgi:hypothetical protein